MPNPEPVIPVLWSIRSSRCFMRATLASYPVGNGPSPEVHDGLELMEISQTCQSDLTPCVFVRWGDVDVGVNDVADKVDPDVVPDHSPENRQFVPGEDVVAAPQLDVVEVTCRRPALLIAASADRTVPGPGEPSHPSQQADHEHEDNQPPQYAEAQESSPSTRNRFGGHGPWLSGIENPFSVGPFPRRRSYQGREKEAIEGHALQSRTPSRLTP